MALLKTECPRLTLLSRGKVRDLYEFPGDGSKLLFVATDRVSAFDVVMKNGVPGKGKLLTQLSKFFFEKFQSIIPNHMISADFDYIATLSEVVGSYRDQLEGRTILVRRCQVLRCEAIVRGYLTGSAYAEYQKGGSVHGIKMPENLLESSKFPEPIFTPSTKADLGSHDQNIHPDKLADVLGDPKLAAEVQKVSLQLYKAANEHCESVGSSLFLADTKFEFGIEPPSPYSKSGSTKASLVLIDECLTPDSSRFWSTEEYREGQKMNGFDKQCLRDWLRENGLDGQSPTGPVDGGVVIPEDVIQMTWSKYLEAFKQLTGKDFGL